MTGKFDVNCHLSNSTDKAAHGEEKMMFGFQGWVFYANSEVRKAY